MTLYNDRYRIETTRLKGWDYSANGYYFVTICTRNRECLFGDVVDGEMRLSAIGEVVQNSWQGIPEHFPNARLDEFVIMPNHIHGIIIIINPVETCHGMSLQRHHGMSLQKQQSNQFSKPKSGSLSMMINHYKSAVSRWCRKNDRDFAWQPRFW